MTPETVQWTDVNGRLNLGVERDGRRLVLEVRASEQDIAGAPKAAEQAVAASVAARTAADERDAVLQLTREKIDPAALSAKVAELQAAREAPTPVLGVKV
jgi:hypothetical protein